MAVVGTAQPLEASCDVDSSGNVSYEIQYQVLTDSRTDGPIMALSASGLPGRGEPYQFYSESDAWAFRTSIVPRLSSVKESAKKWIVTAKFENPDTTSNPDDTGSSNHADPIDINWKISGSFTTLERYTDRDWLGFPIKNTVGELLVDPPIKKEYYVDTVVLERNTVNINLSTRAYLMGTVNGGPFWGLQKRQVKLARWDYQVLYYGNKIPYVNNRWEFHIRYQQHPKTQDEVGWTDIVLNRGTQYLVDDSSTDPTTRYRKFMINNVPSLVCIDDQGQPFDMNDSDAKNKFVWLSFEIEEERDFAMWGFPNPLPGPFA